MSQPNLQAPADNEWTTEPNLVCSDTFKESTDLIRQIRDKLEGSGCIDNEISKLREFCLNLEKGGSESDPDGSINSLLEACISGFEAAAACAFNCKKTEKTPLESTEKLEMSQKSSFDSIFCGMNSEVSEKTQLVAFGDTEPVGLQIPYENKKEKEKITEEAVEEADEEFPEVEVVENKSSVNVQLSSSLAKRSECVQNIRQELLETEGALTNCAALCQRELTEYGFQLTDKLCEAVSSLNAYMLNRRVNKAKIASTSAILQNKWSNFRAHLKSLKNVVEYKEELAEAGINELSAAIGKLMISEMSNRRHNANIIVTAAEIADRTIIDLNTETEQILDCLHQMVIENSTTSSLAVEMQTRYERILKGAPSYHIFELVARELKCYSEMLSNSHFAQLDCEIRGISEHFESTITEIESLHERDSNTLYGLLSSMQTKYRKDISRHECLIRNLRRSANIQRYNEESRKLQEAKAEMSLVEVKNRLLEEKLKLSQANETEARRILTDKSANYEDTIRRLQASNSELIDQIQTAGETVDSCAEKILRIESQIKEQSIDYDEAMILRQAASSDNPAYDLVYQNDARFFEAITSEKSEYAKFTLQSEESADSHRATKEVRRKHEELS